MRDISKKYEIIHDLGNAYVVRNKAVEGRVEILKYDQESSQREQDFFEVSTNTRGSPRDNLQREMRILLELEKSVTKNNIPIVPTVIDRPEENGGFASYFTESIPGFHDIHIKKKEDFQGMVFNLAQILKKHKFSDDDLLMLAGKLSERYAIIHEKGVIVNDIKPRNIVLILNNPYEYTLENPYVIDFGAGFMQGIKEYSRTFGTLPYMRKEELMLYAISQGASVPVFKKGTVDNVVNALEQQPNIPVSHALLDTIVQDLAHQLEDTQIHKDEIPPPLQENDIYAFGLSVMKDHPYLDTARAINNVLHSEIWSLMIAQEMFERSGRKRILKRKRFKKLSLNIEASLQLDEEISFHKIRKAYDYDLMIQNANRVARKISTPIIVFGFLTGGYFVQDYFSSAAFMKHKIKHRLGLDRLVAAEDWQEFRSRIAEEKEVNVITFKEDEFVKGVSFDGKKYTLKESSGASFTDGYDIAYKTLLFKETGNEELLAEIETELKHMLKNARYSRKITPNRVIVAFEAICEGNLRECFRDSSIYENIKDAYNYAIDVFLENRYVGSQDIGFYTSAKNYKAILNKDGQKTIPEGENEGYFVFTPVANPVAIALLHSGYFDVQRMRNHADFVEEHIFRFDGSNYSEALVDTVSFDPEFYFNYFSAGDVNWGLQKDATKRSTSMFVHEQLVEFSLEYVAKTGIIPDYLKRAIDFSFQTFEQHGYFPEEVLWENDSLVFSREKRENMLALGMFINNVERARDILPEYAINENKFNDVLQYFVSNIRTDKKYPGILYEGKMWNSDPVSTIMTDYYALKALSALEKKKREEIL